MISEATQQPLRLDHYPCCTLIYRVIVLLFVINPRCSVAISPPLLLIQLHYITQLFFGPTVLAGVVNICAYAPLGRNTVHIHHQRLILKGCGKQKTRNNGNNEYAEHSSKEHISFTPNLRKILVDNPRWLRYLGFSTRILACREYLLNCFTELCMLLHYSGIAHVNFGKMT